MSRQPDEPPCGGMRVEELTSLIARGDERAFDPFYRQYAPRLYRFLMLLTSGDETAACELHQAILLKAARKMKVFENEEQLWAWLAQIARNHRFDSLRKQLRENRFLALFRTSPDELESTQEDPFLENLQTELKNLEPDEHSLIARFYFEKRSQEQIAQETGRTAKGVQCELARIRKKLKKSLLRSLKNE